MTVKQIESRFDNEWILLGDPETDESLEVSKGKLLCHSKDRDASLSPSRRFAPETFGHPLHGADARGHCDCPVNSPHTLPPSATIDGLLGLDFFRGCSLKLDFRRGRLSLE